MSILIKKGKISFYPDTFRILQNKSVTESALEREKKERGGEKREIGIRVDGGESAAGNLVEREGAEVRDGGQRGVPPVPDQGHPPRPTRRERRAGQGEEATGGGDGHGAHIRAEEQEGFGPRRLPLRCRLRPRPAPLHARRPHLLLYLCNFLITLGFRIQFLPSCLVIPKGIWFSRNCFVRKRMLPVTNPILNLVLPDTHKRFKHNSFFTT